MPQDFRKRFNIKLWYLDCPHCKSMADFMKFHLFQTVPLQKAGKELAVCAELTKGQDMENPTVTPEQVTELIIGNVAGMDGVDQEVLDKFGQALTGFMQTTLEQAAAQEKDNEKSEQ